MAHVCVILTRGNDEVRHEVGLRCLFSKVHLTYCLHDVSSHGGWCVQVAFCHLSKLVGHLLFSPFCCHFVLHQMFDPCISFQNGSINLILVWRASKISMQDVVSVVLKP